MTKWADNDDLFFEEARVGQMYIEKVANQLRAEGLEVEVPELVLRDSIDEASNWLNTKDIICRGRVLEVKSRRIGFTTPEDFPYPTILVDTVSGWEAKSEKPFAYLCISHQTEAIIATRGHDSSKWVAERKSDYVRRIDDDFYLAPCSAWRTFKSLVVSLKSIDR